MKPFHSKVGTGINFVGESLQMINESSFPVTDIYLTLANINFIFSILKKEYNKIKIIYGRHRSLSNIKLQIRIHNTWKCEEKESLKNIQKKLIPVHYRLKKYFHFHLDTNVKNIFHIFCCELKTRYFQINFPL